MNLKAILIVTTVIAATIILLAVSLFSTADIVGANTKTYDSITKSVIIIAGEEEVVKAKLITPLVYKVGVGYQRVAEIEIESFEDFTTFNTLLSKIELYDKNDDMKQFTRKFDYKYKLIEYFYVDDYHCSEEQAKNGSIVNHCVISGQHQESKEVWLPLNEKAFYTKGKLIIGLYTVTIDGEEVEWIPTIGNVKIIEWAVWQAGMHLGNIAYYDMNFTAYIEDRTGHGFN